MYSAKITAEQIEKVEARLGLKLKRYEVGICADHAEYLKKHAAMGKKAPELKPEFKRFIQNEQILAKLDFDYWAERYATLIRDGVDGGGIGKLQVWESQKVVLALIGKLEEDAWDAFSRGEPVDGILIALNKARQLGATQICRSIIMHRLTLYDHTRGFSASVDEDKVLELYDRDVRILDNLPSFLQPAAWGSTAGGANKKGEHIHFAELDSGILYQHGRQQSGLGQGRQFEVSHITEAASLAFPKMLEHDYFPTIPQSPWAFCLAESTPQGRGNWWHQWSEKVRMGRMARWHYLFVPVYIERKKYRRTPPVNWIPSPLTLQRAKKVEETSPRVVGYKFIPDKDHLYWWESTRQEYSEMGSLAIFLTNYADTPESSFQFSTSASLPVDLLQKLRLDTTEPVSYEFQRN